MAQSILIVDDDPTQRRILESVIGSLGYRTMVASDGREALDLLRSPRGAEIDLMLLDLMMPGVNGMTVIGELRPEKPNLPIIVLTSHGSVATVVQSMQAGANDFIVKPASPERLQVSIQNALKLRTLAGEVSRLSRKADNRLRFSDLIAKSLVMRQTIMLAERAAQSNIPILIEGESGVGKEVMARAIQGASDRAGRPFVAVNCGAIPENLVESILFGHEKGAFTGAASKREGKFQEADGGTLFLDEVGELPLNMQVKLLRAIQEGEVDPVGASKPVKVDIRLISATNRNLQQLVGEGKFREDLFYRLNVFPLTLPPLRERKEDIPEMLQHFVSKFGAEEGKTLRGVEPSAIEMLVSYKWPGNVRQLENAVYRAVVLSDRDVLTLHDFPQIVGLASGGDAYGRGAPERGADGEGLYVGKSLDGFSVLDDDGHIRPLEEVEGDMIRLAMEKYNNHMSEIARRLRIGRSTLYRKVRDLGFDNPEGGDPDSDAA